MKLVVGAPVAGRAWALPTWFRCLDAQTVKPDDYIFVYSRSDDNTFDALLGRVWESPEPYVPRERRHGDDHGQSVFRTLANHRNALLAMFVQSDADIFLSLDTDVFLTDPTSIEQLVAALDYLPLSSCLTYLHQHGPPSECFNAGHWVTEGGYDDPTRPWERVSVDLFKHSVSSFGVLQVDIPMAVVAMRREVAETCEYRFHERGEDPGFAQDLDRHGLRTAWLTGLYAPHVMIPEMLPDMVP